MQPIQPLDEDEHGVLRFKHNVLVRHLLDHGGLSMNDLAMVEAPQEDREQFAQLIGYSLSGFGSLSYVSNDTYNAAKEMAGGLDERDARIAALTDTLAEVRIGLRQAAVAAFRVHPDSLEE